MLKNLGNFRRGSSTRTILFLFTSVVMTSVVVATEENLFSAFLVIVVFVAIYGLTFTFIRRHGVTSISLLAIFISIFAATEFKFNIVAMNLHIYDVFFYLFSFAHITFFAQTFREAALGVASSLVFIFFLLTLSWRCEPPHRYSLYSTSLILILSLVVAWGSGNILIERGAPFFNRSQNIYSAFISSFGDLSSLSKAHRFFKMDAQAKYSIPANTIICNPTAPPPHIVLTLVESAMPPGIYPGLEFPAEVYPLFESFDGRIHKLRVETFGGGTWLSDFSVLTGLSTNMFGSMRNFALQLTAGRLHHSLPQYLKACGYDASIIYPSFSQFAGAGIFYRAIGFDKVIDRKAHAAPDERQRDAFYYDEARKLLDAGLNQEPSRPQFIVISTMSTHSPWNFHFAAEAERPDDKSRSGMNSEFEEYKWRLVLAKRDRDAFRSDLEKNYPGEKFLFVAYGDHQPALAQLPFENAQLVADKGLSWQLDPSARAFETYYSVEGLRFVPRIVMPNVQVIEIPHLATLAVVAAGLPLDSVYQLRWSLLETCQGLFVSCEDKSVLTAFQKWLSDDGWISFPHASDIGLYR